MPVLPKIQEFLAKIEAYKPLLAAAGFKPNQTNTREAFARVNANYVTKADMSLLAVDDTVLSGKYPIPVRIYFPKDSTNPQVAIFCHGGGNLCGSITVYDPVVRNLVNATGMILVSIDYRLSPEFAYPTSLNDTRAVIEQIFAVLDGRAIKYRSKQLTLIGDSGGAAINAALVSDRNFVILNQIKNNVLIYPSLDYTLSFPSLDTYGVGYFLEKAKIAWYFECFFQNGEDRHQASPLYRECYPEMPRTMLVVAGYDPFQDEAHAYYTKLLQSGIDVELLRIEGVVHAFLALEDLCPEECGTTYLEIGNFLAK